MCHIRTYLDSCDLSRFVSGRRERELQLAVAPVTGRVFRVYGLGAAVAGVEVEGSVLIRVL